MIGWLLYMSNSQTSYSALILGAGTMIVLGSRLVNKRFLGTYIIVGILLVVAAEFTFDIYARVVVLLGRNPTLTDRTEVWADVLAMQDSPVSRSGI